MYMHKDISTYIYEYKNRHRIKSTSTKCISGKRSHQAKSSSPFSIWLCGRFFSLLWMTRWSTVQTQLKVSLLSCKQINAGTIKPDTYLSFPICEPSIAHPCLPGRPVNHRPPLSQGTQEKRKDAVGVKKEEMRLDGWLKLSEITTEPLQQVENTNTISGGLKCMAESWPQLCSQWLHSFSLACIHLIIYKE